MPKIGMEPVRRQALVQATIAEVGRAGSLDVTVSQIAKTAGMSSALAHHYFGSKDDIFQAAMRHLLKQFRAKVLESLASAPTPYARLQSIVEACFDADQFAPEIVAAWLTFYVRALSNKETARLLAIYTARLRSNLLHDLRLLMDHQKADDVAESMGAIIDGLYIRFALRGHQQSRAEAIRLVTNILDLELKSGTAARTGAFHD